MHAYVTCQLSLSCSSSQEEDVCSGSCVASVVDLKQRNLTDEASRARFVSGHGRHGGRN